MHTHQQLYSHIAGIISPARALHLHPVARWHSSCLICYGATHERINAGENGKTKNRSNEFYMTFIQSKRAKLGENIGTRNV